MRREPALAGSGLYVLGLRAFGLVADSRRSDFLARNYLLEAIGEPDGRNEFDYLHPLRGSECSSLKSLRALRQIAGGTQEEAWPQAPDLQEPHANSVADAGSSLSGLHLSHHEL